ncbi:MAG: 2Fe-2S iron-sulfur cluster binding domain-containing protein [Rhodobacteraceae bacterium]|nr:2Fe-2S iron-sulfur cluster binding domain-containing protein [Paracoccaceae bacterium]
MAQLPLQFRLNGSDVAVFADEADNLLSVLRGKVGDLTPKFGCGQGGCGACMVSVDGKTVLSCVTLAQNVQGRDVESLAGLSGEQLDPLQTAFMDGFAAQCGYCTPGMIVAARALLRRNPNPDRDDIVEAISDNLCRCTGYEPIIDAIQLVAAQERGTRA